MGEHADDQTMAHGSFYMVPSLQPPGQLTGNSWSKGPPGTPAYSDDTRTRESSRSWYPSNGLPSVFLHNAQHHTVSISHFSQKLVLSGTFRTGVLLPKQHWRCILQKHYSMSLGWAHSFGVNQNPFFYKTFYLQNTASQHTGTSTRLYIILFLHI